MTVVCTELSFRYDRIVTGIKSESRKAGFRTGSGRDAIAGPKCWEVATGRTVAGQRSGTIRDYPEIVKSSHRGLALSMAAKAVLALGVAYGKWPDSTWRMAGETIPLEFNSVVGKIGRDGRVVVARTRQQNEEDDDGNNESDEDKIGRLWLEPHEIWLVDALQRP